MICQPQERAIFRSVSRGCDNFVFVQTNTVIKLADLHKTYHTGEVDVHAVRGVSLEVLPGEFVAIMGSSGSGKSTLMNMIGCLDRPSDGHYWLDGTDISTLDRNALADIRNKKIGFVFQGFNLLSRTSALENVEMPMLYNHRRIHSGEQLERATRALEIVAVIFATGANWMNSYSARTKTFCVTATSRPPPTEKP